MSSPDTNTEKQTREHRGPLAGIALSLICVGLLFIAYMVWTADEIGEGDEPEISVTE